ncbi:MAG: DUF502 domain-containing protein [Deltaproteobacteria bacterium]|nr:DUF502 domain-containing protein [Deltaproteobacteria bacterium]
MQNIPKFAFSRIVDGFLVLLPFLLTYLMMGQLFDAMLALAAPIADLMPKGVATSEWALRLEAAGLLVIGCFLVGLAMKTRTARRFGKWIEETFLNRIPPYVILRNLARRLSGSNVPNQLQPALIRTEPGTDLLGFIVEEHTGGKFTVLIPLAPMPGVGTLQIVSREKVRRLEVPMKDALGAILNWGAGTEFLLKTAKDQS